MDTPERTQIAASSTPISKFEDSPFSSYINNLSPIKQVKSTHITQTLNPFTIGSLPSIFTSPHVSSHKESRFLRRHQDLDLSKPEAASTNDDTVKANEAGEAELQEKFATPVAVGENAEYAIELPRNLKYECGSPDCGPLQSSGSDPEPFSQKSSDINNPCEGEEAHHSQQKKEGEGFEWESFVADSADILIFSSPNDAEAFRGIIQRSPATIASYASLMSSYVIEKNEITDVQKMQCQTTSGERPEAGNSSSWPVESNELNETNHVHDNPNDHDLGDVALYSTMNIGDGAGTRLPRATKPISFLHRGRGVRRRCLDFEVVGAHRKSVLDGSSYSPTLSQQSEEKAAPRNLQLVSSKRGGGDSSRCTMPGIGLHLNSLATLTRNKLVKLETLSSESQVANMQTSLNSPITSQELIPYSEKETDYSESVQLQQLLEDASQTSPYLNTEDLSQNSPRKKRRRVEHVGENEACKRCNCKKSKCLKLYCECFAAGVYCIEPCACQDCFNKPIHEDTVLATRKQIESRNPLAFAPKVISTVADIGEQSMKTPASARHKRGCNCKKSSCLKKYCECYQGGVGCSINCRCEGCKNAFGTKDGSIVVGTDCDVEDEDTEKCEKSIVEVRLKPESTKNDDPNHPASGHPTTPSALCRSSVPMMAFPSKSKPPRSSFLSSIGTSFILQQTAGQKLGKPEFLLPPPKFEKLPSFRKETTSNAEEEMLEILRGGGNTTPNTSGVKTSSPNSKRVSPPHPHPHPNPHSGGDQFGSSPSLKSGRRLILQSIPSFPSLHNINET